MPKYDVMCLNMPAQWGLFEAQSVNDAAEQCAKQLFDGLPRNSYEFRIADISRGISCEVSVSVHPTFSVYGRGWSEINERFS